MWQLLKGTVIAFINDEALSRGAAIAFYTVTSIAPLLLIVIALAGIVFGEDASQGAITAQLGSLMGQQTAEVLQSAVANAATKSSSIIATIIGFVTVLVTASGVFVEMQSSLNAIWKAELQGTTLSRWIRARAASIGLVAALGFLLMVSLLVSAGLTAFGNYFNSILPFGESLERSLGLDAGEGCPNAVVNPAPERKRLHVATSDVERVCGVVAALVMVRRAESEHDGVLGLDLDPLDPRPLDGDAGGELHGRIEPQELFDRTLDELQVRSQRGELVRVPE